MYRSSKLNENYMFAVCAVGELVFYTVARIATAFPLEIMRKQTKYLPFLFLVGY